MDSLYNQKDSILLYCAKNLVESPTTFSFNIFVSFLAGTLYSFKILNSDYLLLIFGTVSPILFTLCLYELLLNTNGELLGESLPTVFTKKRLSRFVMFFDCSIIVLFAALIHFNILNYFLTRFLQTLLFPILLLVLLRSAYIIQYKR